jgi:hypothetical protein
MLLGWVSAQPEISARTAQTRLKFQPGLEFWSCNRLLCFNRILSLGRAENSPYNQPLRSNREFEQENEVGQRGWQFLPVLHIIFRILCLWSGVKTDLRFMSIAVYECWPKSLPWLRQNSETWIHIPVFVLLPSFTTNILTKFVVNVFPNKGRRTKMGYSFMSHRLFLGQYS